MKTLVREFDFIGEGNVPLATDESGGPWVRKITGLAPPTCQYKAISGEIGGVEMALTAASQVQVVTLYWGDLLGIDIDNIHSIEWTLRLSVALGTNATLAVGLAGNQNDTIASIAQRMLFTCPNTGVLSVDSDDGTTDTTVASSEILSTKFTRLGFSFAEGGKKDVRAFLNRKDERGKPVLDSSTFSLNAYSGGLQPFVQLQKSASTDLGTVEVVHCKIRGKKSR